MQQNENIPLFWRLELLLRERDNKIEHVNETLVGGRVGDGHLAKGFGESVGAWRDKLVMNEL